MRLGTYHRDSYAAPSMSDRNDTQRNTHEERTRVTAPDGWVLDVMVLRPAPETAPEGVIICGHAMMTDRRSMLRSDRPSLAPTLVAAGFVVLVPDLRGPGMSGPTAAAGGVWTYDDHIADVPVLLDLAERVAPGLPVSLLGHSLFGHVGLAWMGRNPEEARRRVAAVALLAVNMWHPKSWGAHQDVRVRARKALTMMGTRALGRLRGYVPITWTSPKAMDEPNAYWDVLYRSGIEGRWAADDGFDFRTALPSISQPVLHVLSEGDVLDGQPAEAVPFLDPLPNRTVWRLGKAQQYPAELWGLAPDHMRLVTAPKSLPIWQAVAQWLRAALESLGEDAG